MHEYVLLKIKDLYKPFLFLLSLKKIKRIVFISDDLFRFICVLRGAQKLFRSKNFIKKFIKFFLALFKLKSKKFTLLSLSPVLKLKATKRYLKKRKKHFKFKKLFKKFKVLNLKNLFKTKKKYKLNVKVKWYYFGGLLKHLLIKTKTIKWFNLNYLTILIFNMIKLYSKYKFWNKIYKWKWFYYVLFKLILKIKYLVYFFKKKLFNLNINNLYFFILKKKYSFIPLFFKKLNFIRYKKNILYFNNLWNNNKQYYYFYNIFLKFNTINFWNKNMSLYVYNKFKKTIDTIVKKKFTKSKYRIVTSQDVNKFKFDLITKLHGQEGAIEGFTNALLKFSSGIHSVERPLGSWIFAGLSGTGKTEITKVMSKSIALGRPLNLLKLDMSEYSERHAVSKLIGTPPGYIGYSRPTPFVTFLNRNRDNFSIILFDEVEKAHRDITDVLLQGLDEGFITDSTNNIVNLTKAFIILTTNLGCNKIEFTYPPILEVLTKTGVIFYRRYAKLVKRAVTRYFKPEIINRITDIIVFRPLGLNALLAICNKFLKKLGEIIIKGSKNITFAVDITFKKFLIFNSYKPLYGARPLRRLIEKVVEKNISIVSVDFRTSLYRLYSLSFTITKKFKFKFNILMHKATKKDFIQL